MRSANAENGSPVPLVIAVVVVDEGDFAIGAVYRPAKYCFGYIFL
jgi:hypothetical protein